MLLEDPNVLQLKLSSDLYIFIVKANIFIRNFKYSVQSLERDMDVMFYEVVKK